MSTSERINTILLYSGGIDSTVLLYYLKYRLGNKVRCLSVNYDQRHKRELTHAEKITDALGTEYRLIDLSGSKNILAGSSQTSPEIEVPEGHYTEESMKATVVPNRNMILLSLATAWAITTKSGCVAYAPHAGDHAIYPDCRPDFVKAMRNAISACDWNPPLLMTPFITLTKAQIVKIGDEHGVPFAKTYSCYKGGEKHCGKCGTCTERREAFQLAKVNDPTEYLA